MHHIMDLLTFVAMPDLATYMGSHMGHAVLSIMLGLLSVAYAPIHGSIGFTAHLAQLLSTLASPTYDSGALVTKLCSLIAEMQKWSWLAAIFSIVILALGFIFTPMGQDFGGFARGGFGKVVLGLILVGIASPLVTLIGGLVFTGGYTCSGG